MADAVNRCGEVRLYYGFPRLSDRQYALISPFIPPDRESGRPRTTEIEHVLNALLYKVHTGCSWRNLPPPPDFPPWQTVYGYYRSLRKAGVWKNVQHHLSDGVARTSRGGEHSLQSGCTSGTATVRRAPTAFTFPEHGSSFSPSRDGQQSDMARASGGGSNHGTRSVQSPHHARPHVLLVEDELLVNVVVLDILEHAGYRVTATFSGREALDAESRDPADLLLTDLRMPQIEGQELIRCLRAKRPDLPVVVLTSCMPKHIGDNLRDIGPEKLQLLYKPVSERTLLAASEAALNS
jgi:Response regulator containing CheY-like receiver, AAA-type ATPase, and DNA-binding domains